uniref:Uncharacterized protein n=1 Tax=viral metagenome TaxID=1070528 RepID=A0A6C0KUZ2_9ZZZZ
MSSNNEEMFTPESPLSPRSNGMVTPPLYQGNAQQINQQMNALPNVIRAANGAAKNRSMIQALQAPIIENGPSNQQAAMAANAAIKPAVANARIHALANEAIANRVALPPSAAPLVLSAMPPVAPIALDHPATRLMENPLFIAKIFKNITMCGIDVCTIIPNMQFDPLNMTLIGGAVLTIYDYILREYRARKVGRLHQLRQYIQDATRDMDIVWYMTNAPNAIQVIPGLTREIGKQLTECLQKINREGVIQKLIQDELQQPVMVRIMNADLVDRFGTFSIRIEVQINGFPPFTICDCSIHDGYSSQQYDNNHVEFQRNHQHRIIPRPVGTDPTYCDHFNTLLFQIDSSYIRVPQLGRYTDQQLFAFGNLALHNDVLRQPSSMKNLKRILYLIRVISVINTQNWQNTMDIGQLIHSDELNIQLFLNYLYLNVNRKINMILEKNIVLKPTIIAVLHHFHFNNVPMDVLGQSSEPVRHMIHDLLRMSEERSRVRAQEHARMQAQSYGYMYPMQQLHPSPKRGGKYKRKTRKRRN